MCQVGHKPLAGGDPQTPPPQGHVLITFDDGDASVYSKAFPALTTAGLKATFYIPTDNLDTSGIITTAQAQTMYAAGMDVAQHGKTHTNFTTLTQGQIETELTTAKGVLDSASMPRASAHVAYPYGGYDADTLAAMTAQSMKTGRTVDANTFTLASIHGTANGLYLLPIYYTRYGEAVYSSPGTLDNVKNAVASAVSSNKHICLLFHKIVDGTPADQNEFKTSDFSDLLAFINTLHTTVLTISEWYALYQATYP
jgi:peptidoglycan/xylan/chitin deacetylase (PgdA/CDA1 family)